MKKVIHIFALFIILGAVSGSANDINQEGNPSAADIIKRYITALGGEENLRTVQSKKILFKVFLQTRPGYLVESTIHRKRTLKSQRQGSPNHLFFDGEKLWNIKGEQKNELKGKVVDQFRRKADLDGPFLDHDKKGIKIKFLGKKQVEFSHFLILEVIYTDNTKILYYFDETSGLLKMTKKPSFYMLNGKTTPGPKTITYYYDYQKVKGIFYPFFWIQTTDKLDHMHLFKVEKITILKK